MITQTSANQFAGLSSDTKPSVMPSTNFSIPTGFKFLEIDTGLQYDWNGTAWIASLQSDKVISPSDIIPVTLSITPQPYGAGDVICDGQEVANALRSVGGKAILQSLVLVDKDDQGAALTIYFLNANTDFGTASIIPNITDTNATNILGWVDVGTGDYKDLGGVRVANGANLRNLGMMLESPDTSIWLAVINGAGTPTYTASGLVLNLGIFQN